MRGLRDEGDNHGLDRLRREGIFVIMAVLSSRKGGSLQEDEHEANEFEIFDRRR